MSESRISNVAPKPTAAPASSVKRTASGGPAAGTDPFAALLAQSVESLETEKKSAADNDAGDAGTPAESSGATANAADSSAEASTIDSRGSDANALAAMTPPAVPADAQALTAAARNDVPNGIDAAATSASTQALAAAPAQGAEEAAAAGVPHLLAARRSHGAAVAALASSHSAMARADASSGAPETTALDPTREIGLENAVAHADSTANLGERFAAKLDAALLPATGGVPPGLNPAGGAAGAAAAPGFGVHGYEATPQSPTFALSAPIDTPAWPHQFGHVVRLMSREELSQAEVRIHPAELGPIEVRLAIEGDNAAIAFTANSAETRALLEAHMPKLREVLEASGLQLSQSSVQSGPERDARDASSAFENGRGAEANGQAADAAGGSTEVRAGRRTDRLVDVFA